MKGLLAVLLREFPGWWLIISSLRFQTRYGMENYSYVTCYRIACQLVACPFVLFQGIQWSVYSGISDIPSWRWLDEAVEGHVLAAHKLMLTFAGTLSCLQPKMCMKKNH